MCKRQQLPRLQADELFQQLVAALQHGIGGQRALQLHRQVRQAALRLMVRALRSPRTPISDMCRTARCYTAPKRSYAVHGIARTHRTKRSSWQVIGPARLPQSINAPRLCPCISTEDGKKQGSGASVQPAAEQAGGAG